MLSASMLEVTSIHLFIEKSNQFRNLKMLDAIAQGTRACSQPMGGLQVVFCGDFFQLPPVQRNATTT